MVTKRAHTQRSLVLQTFACMWIDVKSASHWMRSVTHKIKNIDNTFEITNCLRRRTKRFDVPTCTANNRWARRCRMLPQRLSTDRREYKKSSSHTEREKEKEQRHYELLRLRYVCMAQQLLVDSQCIMFASAFRRHSSSFDGSTHISTSCAGW